MPLNTLVAISSAVGEVDQWRFEWSTCSSRPSGRAHHGCANGKEVVQGDDRCVSIERSTIVLLAPAQYTAPTRNVACCRWRWWRSCNASAPHGFQEAQHSLGLHCYRHCKFENFKVMATARSERIPSALVATASTRSVCWASRSSSRSARREPSGFNTMTASVGGWSRP